MKKSLKSAIANAKATVINLKGYKKGEIIERHESTINALIKKGAVQSVK